MSPHPAVFRPLQARFLTIPQAPLCYWLRDRFFDLLAGRTLGDVADVCQGLATADDPRFVRFVWEAPPEEWARPVRKRRWVPFEKGGGYGKWFGHHFWVVDWENDGARIKAFPASVVRNEQHYCKEGWTYSVTARGSVGFRHLEGAIFSGQSAGVILRLRAQVAGVTNCRVSSALVRAMTAQMYLRESYISRIPLVDQVHTRLSTFEAACIALKRWLVARDPTERTFGGVSTDGNASLRAWAEGNIAAFERVAAVLHALEGLSEHEVFAAYGIAGEDLQAVLDETGTPAGWYPMIAGYDALPELPEGLPPIPEEFRSALQAHERISPSAQELSRLKQRLQSLYEAGPGTKVEEVAEEEVGGNDREDEEESVALGARIPIPTETFLEELSVKMEFHPVSVYRLLEDMRRKDGLICYPEVKGCVEDYFSVLILRILGHRWPGQVEANEPVPEWADPDGIIPLTENTGERTLLERIRDRIAAEFGEKRVSEVEEEFAEILHKAACQEAETKGRKPPKRKLNLAQWLEGEFFRRHVSQFRKRPVAWHLANSGKTFQILFYYHKLSADTLRNVKNRYLARVRPYYETLLDRARKGGSGTDRTAGELSDIVQELEEFEAALDRVIALPYDPLLDDGVRVNIASLQKAGVLASPVLTTKEIDRAVRDRNVWRKEDQLQETVWEI